MKANIPHIETLLDALQPNKDKAFAKISIAPLPKNLSTRNIITTSQISALTRALGVRDIAPHGNAGGRCAMRKE
jgi:hypothetical protein